MYLSPNHKTNYPEALMREFATGSLGAKRCSADYLSTLRVLLANMSLADRVGVPLRFRIRPGFSTERTMRTLIDQLHRAGLLHVETWVDDLGHSHATKIYYGRLQGDHLEEDAYTLLQRGQEEVDFQRQMHSLGIVEGDCPY